MPGALACATLVACALLTSTRDARASSTYSDTLSLFSTTATAIPAMQLDASSNPVIVFSLGTTGLQLLHCNDSTCQGGDDIPSEIPGVASGFMHGMLLDASGRPVLMLVNSSGSTSTLNLLHCGDAACASGNSLNPLVNVQYNLCCTYYGFALDSAGNPVISYVNAAGELRLIRCNDADCAGNDEADSVVGGPAPNWATVSLVLDVNDYPVVAYTSYPSGSARLGILHCNDVACSGGDDVPSLLPNSDAGYSPAVILDSAGNPVVAHWTAGDLSITHCNDPGCTGNNESTATSPGAGILGANAIALDSGGRPVVVSQSDGGFFTSTCTDVTCSTGINRHRVRVTPLGAMPTLGLDSNDQPILVISAFPESDGMWLIHCGNQECDEDMDGDGCNDLAERSTGPQEYQLQRFGALRDAKNPWDYWNPTHDGQNRIDDVLAVASRYGKNTGDVGYATDFDRTYLGPNAWNLGPPNGQIRIDDVLMQVKQYNHDCS
jgi:hypothetical protein